MGSTGIKEKPILGVFLPDFKGGGFLTFDNLGRHFQNQKQRSRVGELNPQSHHPNEHGVLWASHSALPAQESAQPWASQGQLWLAWPQGSAFLLGFAGFGWVWPRVYSGENGDKESKLGRILNLMTCLRSCTFSRAGSREDRVSAYCGHGRTVVFHPKEVGQLQQAARASARQPTGKAMQRSV